MPPWLQGVLALGAMFAGVIAALFAAQNRDRQSAAERDREHAKEHAEILDLIHKVAENLALNTQLAKSISERHGMVEEWMAGYRSLPLSTGEGLGKWLDKLQVWQASVEGDINELRLRTVALEHACEIEQRKGERRKLT